LVKGGIAAASQPNFSFALSTLQHRSKCLAVFCNCTFYPGAWFLNLAFPWESETAI